MARLIDVLFPNKSAEVDSEQVRQFQHILETSHDPCIQFLVGCGLMLAKVTQQPPSKGYVPALLENGFHPVSARAIATIAVRAGRREANESITRRRVFDAIKFLAAPRQRRAIRSRAKIILAAWEDTSIVETAFSNADQSETELIYILKCAVAGKGVDLSRLEKICAAIAPHLSLDRGPKVRAPSAAHNFLLKSGVELTKKRLPYARQDRAARNVDALTEATEKEFDIPDFDSRPARRRLKRAKNRIK